MDDLLSVVGVITLIALIGFALFVALIVWAVRKAMAKAKTIGQPPEYEHIDTEGQISDERVKSILKRYTHRYAVSDLARAGINSLESAAHKRDSFYATLDSKFKTGTISWDRFAVGADTAFTAIQRNTAQLANAIQAFDSDEYRRMERQFNGVKPADMPDATQAERWGMLQGRLDGMKEIVDGNQKMLLELDRLEAELGKLESTERSAESDDILAEIHTLTEEMKYYR